MPESGERLLLAIDVGNTNVKLGTFRGEELTAHWRLATDPLRMPDERPFTAQVGAMST